jgi:TPR repeat protein
VTQDRAKAVAWFLKAAEQGNVKAQYNLGVMYDTGAGVPRSHTQAVAWYSKAADQGDADAKRALQRLGR